MKIVKFIGAHSSPQAGKPIHLNADAVRIILEGPGSKHDRPVTAIHCGGFPVLVAASLEDTLAALAG